MNWTTLEKIDKETRKLGIQIMIAGDAVIMTKGTNVRLKTLQTELDKAGIDFTRFQLGSPFVEGFGRPMPMGEEPKQIVKVSKAEAPKKAEPKKAKVEGQTAFHDGGKAKTTRKKADENQVSLFDMT